MQLEKRNAILIQLNEQCQNSILDNAQWPIAYCQNVSKVRAILLGCDPSNQHDTQLKYAFGIETETKLLQQFFSGIESNLALFGLSREEIYVQNLCQNYFNDETSKNKHWKVAAKIWLPYLREELDSLFDSATPVFMTAEVVYQALLKDGVKPHKAKDLYSNMDLLPISAVDNYLGRPLYPLYRHQDYNLNKQEDYLAFLRGQF